MKRSECELMVDIVHKLAAQLPHHAKLLLAKFIKTPQACLLNLANKSLKDVAKLCNHPDQKASAAGCAPLSYQC